MLHNFIVHALSHVGTSKPKKNANEDQEIQANNFKTTSI